MPATGPERPWAAPVVWANPLHLGGSFLGGRAWLGRRRDGYVLDWLLGTDDGA